MMTAWLFVKHLWFAWWHAVQQVWHVIHQVSPLLIFAGVIAGFLLTSMGARRLCASRGWWGFLLIVVSLYWGLS